MEVQKFEYLEKDKSSLDKIENIFSWLFKGCYLVKKLKIADLSFKVLSLCFTYKKLKSCESISFQHINITIWSSQRFLETLN